MKRFIISFLIILNFIIFNIRIWLIKYIFGKNISKRLILVLILIGLVSWWSILYYPHLLETFNLSSFDFTNQKISILTNFSTLLYFLFYLSIINISFFFLISKARNLKIFFKLLSTYLLQSIILFILIKNFFNSEILYYYIYVAIWEELVKFFLSLCLFLKFWKVISDMIAFSIFGAISFAFVENFVYLFWNLSNDNISIFIWWTWLIISRWLIWFMAHTIFTWSIGQFIYKYFLSKKTIFLSWFLFWIILHLSYDSLLTINFKRIIPIFILGGYLRLSYLFYNSDRFYNYYYQINATMDKHS